MTTWYAPPSGFCVERASVAGNHGRVALTWGSATRAGDVWRGAAFDWRNVELTYPSRSIMTRSTHASRRNRSRSAAMMVMPRLASSLRMVREPEDRSFRTPSRRRMGVADASARASTCVDDIPDPTQAAASTYVTSRWGAKPQTRTTPASGRKRPAMHRSSVVLPLPTAPQTPTISPARTSTSTPLSTVARA